MNSGGNEDEQTSEERLGEAQLQHMDNTLDVSFRRGTSITTTHVCDGCTGARARPSNEE